jgi:hypothetical protein
MTDEQQPSQGENIPRRKPERLSDMALGFCWPTQIALRETDPSVSGSQIGVQSQRLFASSAALTCTVRCNLDQAQHGVGQRVVRSHRERPGHKRLGRRKASCTGHRWCRWRLVRDACGLNQDNAIAAVKKMLDRFQVI